LENIKERLSEQERTVGIKVEKTVQNHFVWDRSVLSKTLRIRQWVKNILLFLPVLLAHQTIDLNKITTLIIAWLSFSLCASAAYIINDIIDIPYDRNHPVKRHRPFASGQLSISTGIIICGTCLGIGLSIAILYLHTDFLIILTLYMALSLLYSCCLKRLLVADVITLAIMYTLRIFAGGLVLNIPISNWLLTFSLFLFTSLALLKRYSELRQIGKNRTTYKNGRYYEDNDQDLLQLVGVGSGLLAVLVLLLYCQGDAVKEHYLHPEWLFLTAPVLLYWITRFWFLAARGIVDDEPIVFSIRDSTSYFVGGAIVTIFILASYF